MSNTKVGGLSFSVVWDLVDGVPVLNKEKTTYDLLVSDIGDLHVNMQTYYVQNGGAIKAGGGRHYTFRRFSDFKHFGIVQVHLKVKECSKRPQKGCKEMTYSLSAKSMIEYKSQDIIYSDINRSTEVSKSEVFDNAVHGITGVKTEIHATGCIPTQRKVGEYVVDVLETEINRKNYLEQKRPKKKEPDKNVKPAA